MMEMMMEMMEQLSPVITLVGILRLKCHAKPHGCQTGRRGNTKKPIDIENQKTLNVKFSQL